MKGRVGAVGMTARGRAWKSNSGSSAQILPARLVHQERRAKDERECREREEQERRGTNGQRSGTLTRSSSRSLKGILAPGTARGTCAAIFRRRVDILGWAVTS